MTLTVRPQEAIYTKTFLKFIEFQAAKFKACFLAFILKTKK